MQKLFHHFTRPRFRTAMQSRPRWPASLFVAYYRCSMKTRKSVRGRVDQLRMAATRKRRTRVEEEKRKQETTLRKTQYIRKIIRQKKIRMKRSGRQQEEKGAEVGHQLETIMATDEMCISFPRNTNWLRSR